MKRVLRGKIVGKDRDFVNNSVYIEIKCEEDFVHNIYVLCKQYTIRLISYRGTTLITRLELQISEKLEHHERCQAIQLRRVEIYSCD
jgi:hypothetical protein